MLLQAQSVFLQKKKPKSFKERAYRRLGMYKAATFIIIRDSTGKRSCYAIRYWGIMMVYYVETAKEGQGDGGGVASEAVVPCRVSLFSLSQPLILSLSFSNSLFSLSITLSLSFFTSFPFYLSLLLLCEIKLPL